MGRLECGRKKEITDISGDNRGNKLKRGRCGIAGSSLGSYFALAESEVLTWPAVWSSWSYSLITVQIPEPVAVSSDL